MPPRADGMSRIGRRRRRPTSSDMIRTPLIKSQLLPDCVSVCQGVPLGRCQGRVVRTAWRQTAVCVIGV
jgi:hypothetical protein